MLGDVDSDDPNGGAETTVAVVGSGTCSANTSQKAVICSEAL
jgi:hypothetical protein